MLIVISQPHFFAGEAQLINKLFAHGMPLLHLRKPGASGDDLEALIAEIDPRYRPQLVLHQQHDLSALFPIHRWHFPERERQQATVTASHRFLSTSIHRLADYASLSAIFAYVFLSPVFDSISKQGYGAMDADHHPWQIKEKHIPLIALGGITPTNMEQAFQMGFDGVAALGYVWQHTDPCRALEELLKQTA